jgi:hypothetical protein
MVTIRAGARSVSVGTVGPRRASRCVTVGVVLTCIGAGVLLVAGAMFLLGVHDGTFLGSEPTATVGIAGAPIPLDAAPAAGAVMLVVALALIVLAVLARRGRAAGRLGLTGIGALAILGLLYTAVADDPVSPVAPIVWIVVALALLWIGGRTARP